MGAPAVAAVAKKIVATIATQFLKPAEDGGVVRVGIFGLFLVLYICAYLVLHAPMGMWATAQDAISGKYGTSTGGLYQIGLASELPESNEIRWYEKKARELEQWAHAKWPDDSGTSTYTLPNWRFLYALDMAYSENDFKRVQNNENIYDKLHRRILKANKSVRYDEYEKVSTEQVEGSYYSEEKGGYVYIDRVSVIYWSVSFKSFKEIFASGGGLRTGIISEEMVYFANFESANYGGGWGDLGNALGFYQFDRRYGLANFLSFCQEQHPGKFDMFTTWAGAGTIANGDKGLEAAWIQAYDQSPEEFAALQDQWAYENYYMPAEEIAAEYGITLEGRRDCVKGLFWGLTNLNGQGGVKRYISGAGLNDLMSDEELATTLCNYFINNAPQPYPESYANRYRAELETILWYLTQPQQGTSGEPTLNDAYGTMFTAEQKGEIVNNYYKALAAVTIDSWGNVSYDEDKFIRYITGAGGYVGNAVESWVYYNQGDYGGSYGYPIAGDTIASSGCAVTCIAMIWATYSEDPTIDPVSVLPLGQEGRVLDGSNLLYPANVPEASERYGLTGEFITAPKESDWTKIEEALEDGGCALLSLSSNGSGYAFATSGHFVVLVGLSEDKEIAYLADPGSREATWSEITDNGEGKIDISYSNLKNMVNPGLGTHSRDIVILTPIN